VDRAGLAPLAVRLEPARLPTSGTLSACKPSSSRSSFELGVAVLAAILLYSQVTICIN
jgi:hypothetical protein